MVPNGPNGSLNDISGSPKVPLGPQMVPMGPQMVPMSPQMLIVMMFVVVAFVGFLLIVMIVMLICCCFCWVLEVKFERRQSPVRRMMGSIKRERVKLLSAKQCFLRIKFWS